MSNFILIYSDGSKDLANTSIEAEGKATQRLKRYPGHTACIYQLVSQVACEVPVTVTPIVVPVLPKPGSFTEVRG